MQTRVRKEQTEYPVYHTTTLLQRIQLTTRDILQRTRLGNTAFHLPPTYRSAAQSKYLLEVCARRSRWNWPVVTITSPWTHSLRWPSIWITFIQEHRHSHRFSPSGEHSGSEPLLLFFSGSKSRLSAIRIWNHHTHHSTTHPHDGVQSPGEHPLHHQCTSSQNHPRPHLSPTPWPYHLMVEDDNQTGHLNAGGPASLSHVAPRQLRVLWLPFSPTSQRNTRT